MWWNLIPAIKNYQFIIKVINVMSRLINVMSRLIYYLRSCLYDNWKPSFLPRVILNWRTHVGEQKIKCLPIRTREIASVRL